MTRRGHVAQLTNLLQQKIGRLQAMRATMCMHTIAKGSGKRVCRQIDFREEIPQDALKDDAVLWVWVWVWVRVQCRGWRRGGTEK